VADSFKYLKIHIKYKKSPPVALIFPLFVIQIGIQAEIQGGEWEC
jgi:hypothetical protein